MANLKALFKNPVIELCTGIFVFLTVYLFFYFMFAESPVKKVTYEPWTKSLNEHADPCTNFYEFACGNYLGGKQKANHSSTKRQNFYDQKLPFILKCSNESILTNQPSKSTAVKKFRLYRDVYFNSTFDNYKISATKLHEELKLISGCPVLNKQWSSDSFNLTDALLQFTRLTGQMPLFHLYSLRLPDSSVALVLGSNVGKPISYERLFDKDVQPKEESKQAIEKWNFQLLKYLIDESEPSNKESIEQLEEAVEQITNTQFDVWQIQRRGGLGVKWELENDKDGHFIQPINIPLTKMRLERALNLLPFIDKRYFLDNPHVLPDVRQELLNNPYIYIEHKEMVKTLNAFYSNLTADKMANFLCSIYIHSQIQYTEFNASKRLDNRTLEILDLNKESTPINKLGILRKYFQLITDHLFIEHCVDQAVLESVREIADQLKLAAEKMIRQNEWLDEKTRTQALFKLDSMEIYVGGLDVVKDWKLLDIVHENLDFDSNGTLRELYRNLSLFLFQKSLKTWIRPEEYIRGNVPSATYFSAIYKATMNFVYIPASLLLTPLFDVNLPTPVKYGVFAELIGHEIFHGFASTGIYFDAQGAVKQWFHWKTLEAYKKRAQCLLEQYNQVRDTQFALRHLNGSITLKENMADNDGIQAAWYAWKLKEKSVKSECKSGFGKYTDDQLFFISHATVLCTSRSYSYERLYYDKPSHTPSEPRINEVLKNMPEFAKSFNCPIGTSMNPKDKCRVW